MSEVWQTALSILGSIGVGGAIIAALSAWLGKLWAQRFLQKEAEELKEKEERLIKCLERKNYVSKVRFDAEFAIYKELCASTDSMVRTSYFLFPGFENSISKSRDDLLDYYYNQREQVAKIFKDSTECLAKNAAFIPEDQYNLFETLHASCMHQLCGYNQMIHCIEDDENFSEEERRTCNDRAKEIEKDYADLQKKLRDYLKMLDVELTE